MDPFEGVQNFLLGPLIDPAHPLDAKDVERAIAIASVRSKSQAITDGQDYWPTRSDRSIKVYGRREVVSTPYGSTGFGKGCRWLSAMRTSPVADEPTFDEVCEILRKAHERTEWELSSGELVVDRWPSHLHADVATLLPEVLGTIRSGGRARFTAVHDFGRVVGKTTCVATGPGDEIVWAKRPHRGGYTRFVKGCVTEDCTSIVLVLVRLNERVFELRTAYIGREAGPEPWDKRANARNKQFWNSHALVWGSEPTIPGTETSRCPW